MTDKDQNWLVAKVIGPKKEWRAYKARVKRLPRPYVDAVAAIERYLMHFGAMDAASATGLTHDLIDLFEQAAADGTSIRDIVGEDPVEFAEALIRNYDKGGYVAREQNRLRRGIDDAAKEQTQ